MKRIAAPDPHLERLLEVSIALATIAIRQARQAREELAISKALSSWAKS